MKSKITIIGAGLSGMVAGINLARDGYEVEIIEGGKSVGTMEKLHPSVHATPIDPGKVSDYTGIDITGSFIPCRRLMIYLNKKPWELNPGSMHVVERGGRETSLDSHLYSIALKHGVKFQFNTLVKKLDEIPEGAIIASGLVKEGMDAAGVKSAIGTGYYARKKLDNPAYRDVCMAWTAGYTTDYGYLSVVNDLMFYVIFNRGDLTEKQAEEAKQHLIDTEGLEFPGWEFTHGHVPLLGRNSLQLFKNKRILTGTIAGMIDPAAMYGIHGALIAGKIAYLAVIDREKAIKEFNFVNKNYQRVRVLSKFIRMMPLRVPMLNFLFTYPGLMSPVLKIIDDGIPGYNGHWTIESIANRS